MNNCLRGTISRLQQELNKEIEKQINQEEYLSSPDIIQISQTLDILLVQEVREQYAKCKRQPRKKEMHHKH